MERLKRTDIRRPQLNETIIIAYGLYVWFTLSIDPNFFYTAIEKNPESMYAMYLEFLGSQGNVGIYSLVMSLLTGISLFIGNYTLRIVTGFFGLIYFTILAASYVFSYPNLGLGMALLIMGMIIFDINKIISAKEEQAKRKILSDSYKSNEGGE